MPKTVRDKLIVALDVHTKVRALRLVDALDDAAGMFKIGSQLFTAVGPDMVREVVAKGAPVFLDLKFHDIPATVAAAGVEATRLGVSIFNVHALGGSEMMRRTAAAVSECAARENLERPRIIAVTVLTSVAADEMAQMGIASSAQEQTLRLAQLAADSGMDGVVASPKDIEIVRQGVARPDFIIVTPGVRPRGEDEHDQKRVMTPAEAVKAGADYIVVGRPVLAAPDPIEAARTIIREMSDALDGRI
jgi:orotidine-5'-phosphate decarboxylase